MVQFYFFNVIVVFNIYYHKSLGLSLMILLYSDFYMHIAL